MGINIEIDGLDNILDNLENISSKLDGAVQNGVAKGGKAIQAQCKAECPVDTGELRNSIVEETTGGGGKYTSEIGRNGYRYLRRRTTNAVEVSGQQRTMAHDQGAETTAVHGTRF